MNRRPATGLLRHLDTALPRRLAASARAVDGGVTPNGAITGWIADRHEAHRHEARRIPFRELRRWSFQHGTGNLAHDSGKFFRVEGLEVRTEHGPVSHWSQPIIHQPEIGILGILVKEIGGILHCLMQAKSEPGNINGVQISPTVQATRSNYTRVHRGRPVPYLEYFRDARPGSVLVDVLQSEHGSWFYRKCNRNIVVEATEAVEPGADFRWLTIGQLQELLKTDNAVNMDARTVLSCLPAGVEGSPTEASTELAAAIARSANSATGSHHTSVAVMSWITGRQCQHSVDTRAIPLARVDRWTLSADEISHELGLFFSIIAVEVATNGREVAEWTQPLLRPHGVGVVALLVTRLDGVLHVLVNAKVEPGHRDVVELAPTVQCTAENHAGAPGGAAYPPFLDLVLDPQPGSVLFAAELSEEGGRLHHARSRYQIIEVDPDLCDEPLADFRWVTLHQLAELVRHGHFVNIQARSLIACLRGLR